MLNDTSLNDYSMFVNLVIKDRVKKYTNPEDFGVGVPVINDAISVY